MRRKKNKEDGKQKRKKRDAFNRKIIKKECHVLLY
jgi:hypothetical protein